VSFIQTELKVARRLKEIGMVLCDILFVGVPNFAHPTARGVINLKNQGIMGGAFKGTPQKGVL